MLDRICAHIHNYFTDEDDIREGIWTITGGTIELPFLTNGQYFRIVGSTLNDGVYQYPVTVEQGKTPELSDETFTGQIWPMKVPKAVRDLAAEIKTWADQYGAVMASPYTSESVIGVYSYNKAAAGNSGGMDADAWQSAFKARLNPWRKLR